MHSRNPAPRLYNLARWQRVRGFELARNPLCARCQARGRITPANVVHHNPPWQGDEQRFWSGPFECLCAECHDNDANREERDGYSPELGVDGWPADSRHPANRKPISREASDPRPDWMLPSTIPLTIVCGPPASGKTSYVLDHAQPGDLILDLDEIACRLARIPTTHDWHRRWLDAALTERNARLVDIGRPCRWPAAWLIVTERQAWQDSLLPHRVIVLDTPADLCHQRITARGGRREAQQHQAVDAWFAARQAEAA